MRASRRIVAALLVAVSLALLALPFRVQSVPLYAARQGLMCQTCHFDPNGGGPRNEFGFGFAKNRHLLTPEDSTSRWADLTVMDVDPLRLGATDPGRLLDGKILATIVAGQLAYAAPSLKAAK